MTSETTFDNDAMAIDDSILEATGAEATALPANDHGHTATYSPEDNKLRLYPAFYLSDADKERLKKFGFKWGGKTQAFIAPGWTPGREDLLLMYFVTDIGDEDTSLMTRAENRSERFETYSASREAEGNRAYDTNSKLVERFAYGQPILVGHHSERSARRDQARAHRAMDKAVKCWETSEYWQRRAQAALAHAAYKERPDVRYRRIAGLKSDLRKFQRSLEQINTSIALWSDTSLSLEQLRRKDQHYPLYFSFPLSQYPRDFETYEGSITLFCAIDRKIITLDTARAKCLAVLKRNQTHSTRWITHLELRIAYETAMLGEQGGIVGTQFNYEIGGQVKCRGTWHKIIRVNKRNGVVNSVTTDCRYVSIRTLDEIQDYQAPSDAVKAQVKAASKLPPICNFEAPHHLNFTQAEIDATSREQRHYRRLTNEFGTYRLLHIEGYVAKEKYPGHSRFKLAPVFIVDAKVKRPAPAESTQAAPISDPTPMPDVKAPSTKVNDDEQDRAEKIRQAKTILEQSVTIEAIDQLFWTPELVVEGMINELSLKPGDRILEPSAGTGAILKRLPKHCHLTAIEIHAGLAAQLRPFADLVLNQDFLTLQPDALGFFDAIVMNPPFRKGSDITHIHHALNFLKPGGTLVAICVNSTNQQENINKLLRNLIINCVELSVDTFKDQGTTVSTQRVTLRKPLPTSN